MSYHTPAASLRDGHQIPLLGFGTWRIDPSEAQRSVEQALAAGYRHLDTATAYRNEAEVGAGLKGSGVPREEVFITTKLPPRHFGQDREVLEQSLEKLGLDRIDLWLVHAPGGDDHDDPRPDVWENFVQAQADGLVSSIGVSNYQLDQIDALVNATGVTPVVNQIEWTPFRHDTAIAQGLAQRGIVLEGYSPLRSSNLADPTLLEVAAAHRVGDRPATAADVVLAWHVRHGFVVLPRSTRPERIVANAEGSFLELSDQEMGRVDDLAGTWQPEE